MTPRHYLGYVGFGTAVLAYLCVLAVVSTSVHPVAAGITLLLTFPFILPVSARILGWAERDPT